MNSKIIRHRYKNGIICEEVISDTDLEKERLIIFSDESHPERNGVYKETGIIGSIKFCGDLSDNKNDLNIKPLTMKDEQLNVGNNLRARMVSLRSYIEQVKCGFVTFEIKDRMMSGEMNKFFPYDQARAQFIRNLEAELVKLEEEYNSL
jgi:hypothetical protein